MHIEQTHWIRPHVLSLGVALGIFCILNMGAIDMVYAQQPGQSIPPEGEIVIPPEGTIIIPPEGKTPKAFKPVTLSVPLPVKTPKGDPFTNTVDATQTGNILFDYLSIIYRWIAGIIAAVAVVMIIIAGFMMIFASGNQQVMDEAKSRLIGAILGLVLLITTALLLWTINPGFFGNIGIYRPGQVVSAPAGTTPTPTPAPAPGPTPVPAPLPAGTLTHEDAKKQLEDAGIIIRSTGDCSDKNNPRCTSLDGVAQETIDNAIAFKKKCDAAKTSCNVVVTAGTETGHGSMHTNGRKLDLSLDPTVTSYIESTPGEFTPITPRGRTINRNGQQVTVFDQGFEDRDGNRYYKEMEFNDNANSNQAPHWDVQFS